MPDMREILQIAKADPPPARPSGVPILPTSAPDTAGPATDAVRRPRTALLVGGLVASVVLALVGARWSAGADHEAQRSATLADADRLADLSAGEGHLDVALLLEPPEFLETAKVVDMLLAVPKYGRVKVNKVLQVCRISPSKTIGGLSERQRAELISMLRR